MEAVKSRYEDTKDTVKCRRMRDMKRLPQTFIARKKYNIYSKACNLFIIELLYL